MKFRSATIMTILLAFSLSFASFAQRPDGARRPDGVGGKRPDGVGGTRPDGARRPDGVGGKRPDGATPGQRPGGSGRPGGGGRPRG